MHHDARCTVDDTLLRYIDAHSLREHPAQAALREATRSHPHAGMQIARRPGAVHGAAGAADRRRAAPSRSAPSPATARYASRWPCPPTAGVLACDISDEYTRVGRPFWKQAGVEHKIELVLGPALATLDARLDAGEAGRYDFAFIDADKTSYDGYYERCLRLVRTGRPDRVRQHAVERRGGQARRPTPTRVALQALNDKLHRDERVDISLLDGRRRRDAGAQALNGTLGTSQAMPA